LFNLIPSSDEISIFRLLDGDERKKVAGCFELVKYPAGSICIKEGAKISNIGIVASGKLQFERHNHITRRPMLLAVLEKGAHVGDFSLMSERGSMGQVRAIEDTELLITSRDKLDEFMQEYPYAGIKILKGISTVLSIRLKSAIDKVMVLS
jgi:CRP-like cAMP-binding protein